MQPLVECIPNFSEGQDLNIIKKITGQIERVKNVYLLHVDSSFSANRTVVTFIGNPEAVVEAAFAAIQTASNLIDMSQHHGVHPRLGSTDVCPLVPYRGISMQETVGLARNLAQRVGQELLIPVYFMIRENAQMVIWSAVFLGCSYLLKKYWWNTLED